MIPLLRPDPPRLSRNAGLLAGIEDSGTFSNFGPVNTKFESDLCDRLFGGTGACMTVCNATIGLMLALQEAMKDRTARQRYALMPSFTFAATAQAALWCGLTPLLCDIDRTTWAPCAKAEAALLRKYEGEIAVVLPYATFGYDIDLQRYTRLWQDEGVPVVVDAAASLGTISTGGIGFGAGFPGSVVFSMHATKSFAVGEGGVIHSADTDLIARLRAMANFGFGQPRTATMLGINAKLSEVAALTAQLRLQEYDEIVRRRAALSKQYRSRLGWMRFQAASPRLQAHQFVPAMLPRLAAPLRSQIQKLLREAGIGTATYFDPHLAEQPYIAANSVAGDLRVTRDVASRMISLPLYDGMGAEEVDEVCDRLTEVVGASLGSLPDPDRPAESELALVRMLAARNARAAAGSVLGAD